MLAYLCAVLSEVAPTALFGTDSSSLPPMAARPAPFPVFPLLLLGLTYAVLGFFADVSRGGRWSAVHSLLFGYLVLVAPLLLGRAAHTAWPNRRASFLHRAVVYASAGYVPLLLLSFLWVS